MLKGTLLQTLEQAKLRRHDINMMMKIAANKQHERLLKHLEIRLGGLVVMTEQIIKIIESKTEEK